MVIALGRIFLRGYFRKRPVLETTSDLELKIRVKIWVTIRMANDIAEKRLLGG